MRLISAVSLTEWKVPSSSFLGVGVEGLDPARSSEVYLDVLRNQLARMQAKFAEIVFKSRKRGISARNAGLPGAPPVKAPLI